MSDLEMAICMGLVGFASFFSYNAGVGRGAELTLEKLSQMGFIKLKEENGDVTITSVRKD